MLKAAAAQATIGNIRRRLGDHEAAIAAYRASIAKFRQLPPSREYEISIAAIHNHIGHVMRFDGQQEAGLAEHQIARVRLSEISEALGNELAPRKIVIDNYAGQDRTGSDALPHGSSREARNGPA